MSNKYSYPQRIKSTNMKKRNRLYLDRAKFDKSYDNYFNKEQGAPSAKAILVRKRIMRSPKRANKLMEHEAWQDEMSSICPGWS